MTGLALLPSTFAHVFAGADPTHVMPPPRSRVLLRVRVSLGTCGHSGVPTKSRAGYAALFKPVLCGPLSMASTTAALPASLQRVCFVVRMSLRAMRLGGFVRTARSHKSALPVAVPHVVGVSAEEQVRGVHARGHVARMADLDTWRDFTVGQNPSHAMRGLRPTPCEDFTVPALIGGGFPEPATASAAHLGPETFNYGIHAVNLTHVPARKQVRP